MNVISIKMQLVQACQILLSINTLKAKAICFLPYLVKEASAKPILDNDEAKYTELKAKLNINGSAITTGHPNTSSGARIMMTAAYNLKENGGGYAACAICGGLTQGGGALIWVES